MFAFLLPLASKVIKDAVTKIPENEDLGEKLIDICLVILSKAVKLTKTDMDDQLLEVVSKAIRTRDDA
jgi:DNA-directed RNA polymerase subunit F